MIQLEKRPWKFRYSTANVSHSQDTNVISIKMILMKPAEMYSIEEEKSFYISLCPQIVLVTK